MKKCFLYLLLIIIFQVKGMPDCFEIRGEGHSQEKFSSFINGEFDKLRSNKKGENLIDKIDAISKDLKITIKISNDSNELAQFSHGLNIDEFDEHGFPKKQTNLIIYVNPVIKDGGDTIVSFKGNKPQVMCRSSHIARTMNLGTENVVVSGMGYCPFYMVLAHELIHLLHFLETLQFQKTKEYSPDFIPYGKAISITTAEEYFSYIMDTDTKINELVSSNRETINEILSKSSEIYQQILSKIEISNIKQKNRLKGSIVNIPNQNLKANIDYGILLKIMFLKDTLEEFQETCTIYNIDIAEQIKKVDDLSEKIKSVVLIKEVIENTAVQNVPELEDTIKIYRIFNHDLWKAKRDLPWPNFEERRTVLGSRKDDISELEIKLSDGYPIRYFYDEKWGMLCEKKSIFDKILNSLGIKDYSYIDDNSYITGVNFSIEEDSLQYLPIDIRIMLGDRNLNQIKNITDIFGVGVLPREKRVPITPSPKKNLDQADNSDGHTPHGSDISSDSEKDKGF